MIIKKNGYPVSFRIKTSRKLRHFLLNVLCGGLSIAAEFSIVGIEDFFGPIGVGFEHCSCDCSLQKPAIFMGTT